MIAVRPANSSPSTTTLVRPGGFAWWYVDLLDDQGDGLVLIWSWGLPFLPGSGVRPAVERPSVNLALYRGWRPELYLLQELPPEAAAWEGDRWNLGGSVFTRSITDRVHLIADLDLPVPGGAPVRGRVELEGAALHGVGEERGDHEWAPATGVARGTAELRSGSDTWSLRGPAYHDRNAAASALPSLGIRRWVWGRVVGDEELLTWYALWPRQGLPRTLVLRSRGGVVQRMRGEVELLDPTSGWHGMTSWNRMALRAGGEELLVADLRPAVDEGPFYVRRLGSAVVGGKTLPVVTEVCDPPRIDRGWTRPLVSMAVHRTAGPNSMWLPLFAGPRRGRFGRLARSWAGSP